MKTVSTKQLLFNILIPLEEAGDVLSVRFCTCKDLQRSGIGGHGDHRLTQYDEVTREDREWRDGAAGGPS